jgi:site-specific DNA recombinase
MKAAIYCRVSTIDKGQTLEQQELPLIEYCQKEGWEYEIFKDFASGSKESRPQLDVMIQKIRNKEFQAIMIFRLDRLGRSLRHLLQLVEEFNNLKVRVIFHQNNLDTNTAQGMFTFQILGAAAEFERQLIRERINDKLRYIDGQIKENGFYIAKSGRKIQGRGRPSGSKDKKERRKSGYYLRWQNKK